MLTAELIQYYKAVNSTPHAAADTSSRTFSLPLSFPVHVEPDLFMYQSERDSALVMCLSATKPVLLFTKKYVQHVTHTSQIIVFQILLIYSLTCDLDQLFFLRGCRLSFEDWSD